MKSRALIRFSGYSAPGMNLKEKTLLFLAEYVGTSVVRLLGATLRIRVIGKRYHEERKKGATQRVAYAFWHRNIIPLSVTYANQGACVMVSEHKDGEIITRIIKRMGFTTVRGSTTRGGAKALKSMLRFIKEHEADIAITPDGPRGPACKVQNGAVFIASRSGFPLVPVGVALDRAWILSSWDGFRLPKPFSRCAVVVGEEIEVGKLKGEGEIEGAAELLEKALEKAEKAAAEQLRCWNA